MASRVLWLMVWVGACGAPPQAIEIRAMPRATEGDASVAPARVPAPATAVVAAEPSAESEEPVGAVPIPGDDDVPGVDEVDTTIDDHDLPTASPSPRPLQVTTVRGDVWVALQADQDQLELWIGSGGDGGTRAHYPLGPARSLVTNHTYDGNTYPARDHVGDYTGPIVFAVRVTAPRATTPDQVVVVRDGTSLRVVRRALGARAWTPVLSLAFAPGSTFIGIGTTDPH
jgi:hypothetical protein